MEPLRPLELSEPTPTWTRAQPGIPEVDQVLARCRTSWLTACAAWGFAAVVVLTSLFLWTGGSAEIPSTLMAVVGMVASLGIMGGVGCVQAARLSDQEQSRLAVSDLPPVAKAMLAVALEQGFWAFHRVLPVVRQHVATHRPGSRALGQFKYPRSFE